MYRILQPFSLCTIAIIISYYSTTLYLYSRTTEDSTNVVKKMYHVPIVCTAYVCHYTRDITKSSKKNLSQIILKV